MHFLFPEQAACPCFNQAKRFAHNVWVVVVVDLMSWRRPKSSTQEWHVIFVWSWTTRSWRHTKDEPEQSYFEYHRRHLFYRNWTAIALHRLRINGAKTQMSDMVAAFGRDSCLGLESAGALSVPPRIHLQADQQKQQEKRRKSDRLQSSI